MSLSDVLTAHADIFRKKTGVSSKLTIADMTRLLDDLTWGKENLLKGTNNQWTTLTVGGWLDASTSSDPYLKFNGTPVGTRFTYSATIENTLSEPVELQVWLCDDQKARLASDVIGNGFEISEYLGTGQTKDISISFTQLNGSVYAQVGIYSYSGTVPQNSTFRVKNERLYIGTEPGIWTPNLADKVGGGN